MKSAQLWARVGKETVQFNAKASITLPFEESLRRPLSVVK